MLWCGVVLCCVVVCCVVMWCGKIRQDKTQDKTRSVREDKTRHDKTRQGKIKQDKTIVYKYKTRRGLGKTRHDMTLDLGKGLKGLLHDMDYKNPVSCEG